MAAPVLGLRGTGSFTANTIRPKNYREGILLLFPNASAPLTALLSKLSEQATDDPEFKWFEKLLPDQTALLSVDATTTDTTLALVTAADYTKFKSGHVVLNVNTGEIMWIVSSISGFIQVLRAQGTVSATAIGASDPIIVIGTAYSEGDGVSDAITYDPATVLNYTQIFRNVFDITGTATATRIRYGDGQFAKEARREALELHSIEMERAFIFGSKNENLTYGSQPTRTTGGLSHFVTTNVTDFAGSLDIDSWENALQDIFKDGSAEKLALVGNRFLNVVNKVARAHYTIEATPTDKTYGMSMTTWITPYGTLQIKQHPLLSRDSNFNDWAFIVDPAKIKYRYLRGRDTQYRENVQNPGDDSIKNEFMSECGLEINHETAHGIMKNATNFAA
jgi:hypothetical protein